MANSIKARITGNGFITTQSSTLTLKNTLKDEISIKEISNVIEGTPANGDTIVYNSSLNKYEVKAISVSSNNITSIDGGTF